MVAGELRRTCGGGAQPPAAGVGVAVAVAAGRVVRNQIPGGRRALVGASGPGFAADSEKDSSHRAQPARQHQDKPTQQLVCRFLLSWGQVVVAVDAPAGHRGDPG